MSAIPNRKHTKMLIKIRPLLWEPIKVPTAIKGHSKLRRRQMPLHRHTSLHMHSSKFPRDSNSDRLNRRRRHSNNRFVPDMGRQHPKPMATRPLTHRFITLFAGRTS